MKKIFFEAMRKIIIVFGPIYIVILLFNIFVLNDDSDGASKPAGPANTTIDLKLENTSISQFVDFVYEFSNQNRLTVNWFGWYRVEDPVTWFESEELASQFIMSVHVLQGESGDLFITSNLDEKSVHIVIDYKKGTKTSDLWVKISDDFIKQLQAKIW
jgi:hypothetical protein